MKKRNRKKESGSGFSTARSLRFSAKGRRGWATRQDKARSDGFCIVSARLGFVECMAGLRGAASADGHRHDAA